MYAHSWSGNCCNMHVHACISHINVHMEALEYIHTGLPVIPTLGWWWLRNTTANHWCTKAYRLIAALFRMLTYFSTYMQDITCRGASVLLVMMGLVHLNAQSWILITCSSFLQIALATRLVVPTCSVTQLATVHVSLVFWVQSATAALAAKFSIALGFVKVSCRRKSCFVDYEGTESTLFHLCICQSEQLRIQMEMGELRPPASPTIRSVIEHWQFSDMREGSTRKQTLKFCQWVAELWVASLTPWLPWSHGLNERGTVGWGASHAAVYGRGWGMRNCLIVCGRAAARAVQRGCVVTLLTTICATQTTIFLSGQVWTWGRWRDRLGW